MTSHLRDVNTLQCNVAHSSVHSLQKRCLRILSPPVTKHDPPDSRKAVKLEAAESNEKKEQSKNMRGGPVAKTAADSARPEKPPSRRIQRPTSIRRPKLIGKSVEGAAMQAMAASRHRARSVATRGASPFQKTSKSEALAEGPGAKIIVASSTKRDESRDEGQQVDAQLSQDQGALVPELAFLLKGYAATLSLTSPSPFHHSWIIEALLNMYWPAKPAKGAVPSSLCGFLITRSVHLWSSACVPFGFPDRMMENVSGYFAQWLSMSNPEFNLLQLDALSQRATMVSPSSTVMVELKRVNGRNLCVVLRTSLRSKSGHKEPAMHCEAWMLMLADEDEVTPTPAKRKRRKGVDTRERESTLVDKKNCGFAVSFKDCSFCLFLKLVADYLTVRKLVEYSRVSASKSSSSIFRRS